MTTPATMTSKFCLACGKAIDGRSEICPLCGVRQPMSYAPAYPVQPVVPGKSRVAAGLFAIFLGGLGIHKFYLGRIGQGMIYLLFSWTAIPLIVGFIEGIMYLMKTDAEFAAEYD